jgi:hypothetical protein
MSRWVGRTYQHANREVLIEGDLLPVRLRRSGMAKGAMSGVGTRSETLPAGVPAAGSDTRT